MFLPDVNVWLALAFDFHLHHAAAKIWFDESSDACCFCRWSQHGFLRLATNPVVFGMQALSLKYSRGD
jgi:predicted nucleic acid-binding protein